MKPFLIRTSNKHWPGRFVTIYITGRHHLIVALYGKRNHREQVEGAVRRLQVQIWFEESRWGIAPCENNWGCQTSRPILFLLSLHLWCMACAAPYLPEIKRQAGASVALTSPLFLYSHLGKFVASRREESKTTCRHDGPLSLQSRHNAVKGKGSKFKV